MSDLRWMMKLLMAAVLIMFLMNLFYVIVPEKNNSLHAELEGGPFIKRPEDPDSLPLVSSRRDDQAKWVYEPPSIDGNADDWSTFTPIPIGSDGNIVFLYLANDDEYLYVCINVFSDITNEADINDRVLFLFDANNDNDFVKEIAENQPNQNTDDNYVQWTGDYQSSNIYNGAGWVNDEYSGNGIKLWWPDSFSTLTEWGYEWGVGFSGTPAHMIYEFQIPFSKWHYSTGDTIGYGGIVWKSGTGDPIATWPPTLNMGSPSTFNHFTLAEGNQLPQYSNPSANLTFVPNNDTTPITLSVEASDPDGNVSDVLVNLTCIGKNSVQPMYDDGTNGDLIALDGIYSISTTVSRDTLPGLKELNFTVFDDNILDQGIARGNFSFTVVQANLTPEIRPDAPDNVTLFEDAPPRFISLEDIFLDRNDNTTLEYFIEREPGIWNKTRHSEIANYTLLENASLMISPDPDVFGEDIIRLKARNNMSLEVPEPFELSISVLPVNDHPVVTDLNISGQSGNISIRFSMSDLENDPCNISVQYQNNQVNNSWMNATLKEDPRGLLPGDNLSLTWCSKADQNNSEGDYYFIRITPMDNDTGISLTSAPILVDNKDPAPFEPVADPPSWSNNSSPVLNFSAIDLGSGIDRYEYRIGNGTFLKCASPLQLPEMEDGIHDITVRAFDMEGNYRDQSTRVYIDTKAPMVSFSQPNNEEWFNVKKVNISWQSFNELSGIEEYSISLDNSEYLNIGNKTYFMTNFHRDGEHLVQLKARDKAGNMAETSIKVRIDTFGPEIQITLPGEAEILNYRNVKIQWQASDFGIGISLFQVGLNELDLQDIGVEYAYTFDNLPDGSYQIYVKATDKLGNSNITSIKFQVKLGTAPKEDPELTNTSKGNNQIFYAMILIAVILIIFLIVLSILIARKGKKKQTRKKPSPAIEDDLLSDIEPAGPDLHVTSHRMASSFQPVASYNDYGTDPYWSSQHHGSYYTARDDGFQYYDPFGEFMFFESMDKKGDSKLFIPMEAVLCSLCAREILPGEFGFHCHCNKKYHPECIRQAKICPHCRKDIKEKELQWNPEQLEDELEIDFGLDMELEENISKLIVAPDHISCKICRGTIRKKDTAFQCSCNEIYHIKCMTKAIECHSCGKRVTDEILDMMKRRREKKAPQIVTKEKEKVEYSLEGESFTSNEALSCTICLGIIKPGSPIFKCACERVFHEVCAVRVGMCPLCEAEIEIQTDSTFSDEFVEEFKDEEDEYEPEKYEGDIKTALEEDDSLPNVITIADPSTPHGAFHLYNMLLAKKGSDIRIGSKSTRREIRKARRTIIRKYHPDKWMKDKKKATFFTQKINSAWDVLRDY